jgi:hypothetical protein
VATGTDWPAKPGPPAFYAGHPATAERLDHHHRQRPDGGAGVEGGVALEVDARLDEPADEGVVEGRRLGGRLGGIVLGRDGRLAARQPIEVGQELRVVVVTDQLQAHRCVPLSPTFNVQRRTGDVLPPSLTVPSTRRKLRLRYSA